MKKISNSLQETEQIAKEFLATLNGGEVVALSGELGAGKTTFVKMIAEELGIEEDVASPTFVYLKSYKLPKPKQGIAQLCHIDAYRLISSLELVEVGVEEFFNDPQTLCFIEWAENVPDIIPPNAQWIHIEREGETRTFSLKRKPPIN